MHYILLIYFNSKPLCVSSRLAAHHLEDQLGINSGWYSHAFILGDCLLQQTITQNKRMLYQLLFIPYPTAFLYGNGMVLKFYQQQESSTTKTVHKVINKGLKAYV